MIIQLSKNIRFMEVCPETKGAKTIDPREDGPGGLADTLKVFKITSNGIKRITINNRYYNKTIICMSLHIHSAR